MKDLKYSEILKLNKELGKAFGDGEKYHIVILSNVITSQLTDILDYSLRSQKINSRTISGDYDNITQDSLKYADSDLVVIFWEAANLIDGLQYKISLMDIDAIGRLVSRVKSEIDFVFANLEKTSLVIFNTFSSLVFNYNYINENQFDTICDQLNEYLHQKARPNTLLIDINKIFASIQKCRFSVLLFFQGFIYYRVL
jgi:predicted enzyme involved in methoxymalonyl-ACP biosynthesis